MEGAAGLGGRVLFRLLADRYGAKPVLVAGLAVRHRRDADTRRHVLALAFFACCAAHSGPIFHTVSYAIGCGLPMTAAVTIYSWRAKPSARASSGPCSVRRACCPAWAWRSVR